MDSSVLGPMSPKVVNEISLRAIGKVPAVTDIPGPPRVWVSDPGERDKIAQALADHGYNVSSDAVGLRIYGHGDGLAETYVSLLRCGFHPHPSDMITITGRGEPVPVFSGRVVHVTRARRALEALAEHTRLGGTATGTIERLAREGFNLATLQTNLILNPNLVKVLLNGDVRYPLPEATAVAADGGAPNWTGHPTTSWACGGSGGTTGSRRKSVNGGDEEANPPTPKPGGAEAEQDDGFVWVEYNHAEGRVVTIHRDASAAARSSARAEHRTGVMPVRWGQSVVEALAEWLR